MKVRKVVPWALAPLALVALYGLMRRPLGGEGDRTGASCGALCTLQPGYAGRDRAAPDFELPDRTGRKVRLSSFWGRTVVLNFWTKDCEPCLRELPSLAALARSSQGRFVVLTVSADEGPASIQAVLAEILKGAAGSLPVLFDPELAVIKGRYGTSLYPETYLIDPKGMIRVRVDGERDWNSPLALEVIEMLSRPTSCPIEFDKGRPLGRYADLCPG